MRPDDFRDTLAKLRPVIGEMADAFWLATLIDPAQERDIHAVARALATEFLEESYTSTHVLLQPPPRHQALGAYALGSVAYAGRLVCPFGLREHELPQHIAILGRSGAGKTNVSYLLVLGLLRAGKPLLVMDWRRNYRHLTARPDAKELLVLRAGEPGTLSFNPLDPPKGLTASQREAYLQDILSTLCYTYLLGQHLLTTRGVEYLLLRAAGMLTALNPEPLTFGSLQSYLAAYKPQSRENEWKVSAASMLLRLTTGPLGRIFCTPAGRDFRQLLSCQVVLEVDSLGSETDRAAFAKALFLWLFYHRLAEGRSSSAKHVLVVEEAHQCFLRRADGQQSLPDLMLRQMRDLGQALVLLDQNPSLLSVPSLGNTATTICLNLKHGDDVEAAGKALTLPREQWGDIGKLGVGEAVVKVAGRFPTPFLVRFPFVPITEPEKALQPPSSLPGTPSPAPSPETTHSASDEPLRPPRAAPTQPSRQSDDNVQEQSLLMDIAQHPLAVVTERYERLGWTAHTGTKVKAQLLRAGLIAQESIRVPRGSVALLKLTPEGQALAKAWGADVKPFPKNGGPEHEYWKHMVAEDYRRRDYHVEEEVPIGGGKAVDLVATKGTERIAIEIETGSSDAQANADKCRDAGFTRVVVVPTHSAARKDCLLRPVQPASASSARPPSGLYTFTTKQWL